MTINLKPGSTVMFTGDSITDLWRPPGEDRCGYPLLIAGEWCFRHPGCPVTWLNSGHAGDKAMDLEARWQADVLDAEPDVVSILVGVNDMGWHTLDPRGRVIPVEEFAACYDRLLAPLASRGTELVLIEPFLVPVKGVVERVLHGVDGERVVVIDDAVREEWRFDLDAKIRVVRELAGEYGAQLLAADRMFGSLVGEDPGRWSDDGIHPTPAGHGALADAWLRLVG
ncbi:lipase [Amycolatopsis sp. NBRC 101858]|uniref:GDSL-type esterase/lipase family protein n=1 Tax=Amycolatopsis sp. NBRC 101858 TaxID=3032200 RepID=UPI0024A1228E|nr:GDSL-type esterase/lipase family protein [Amycolatopsis sp. NBRC 101858]GLY35682.1 lipase [Amycolatopsis sp. NBRC 101858]